MTQLLKYKTLEIRTVFRLLIDLLQNRLTLCLFSCSSQMPMLVILFQQIPTLFLSKQNTKTELEVQNAAVMLAAWLTELTG